MQFGRPKGRLFAWRCAAPTTGFSGGRFGIGRHEWRHFCLLKTGSTRKFPVTTTLVFWSAKQATPQTETA